MAEWKKIIVSGSGLSQLNNDSGYLTSFGSVTQHTDVTDAGSGKIITDTERTTLGTALQSLGSVTGHTDVTKAGSGEIITDEERASIGALNTFTGSLNANFATDAELAAVSGALASDISAIDKSVPAIKSDGSSPSFNSGISKAEVQTLLNVADGAEVNVDTNISVVENASTVDIKSSTGTNDSIAAATQAKAGVLTASDKTKLDNIASNANNYTLTIADVKSVLGGSMPGNSLSIGDADDVVSIANDLIVSGDLTVSGTTTTIDTVNLNVTDQFINLNNGGKDADGGLVIEDASEEGKGGRAFGWDFSADRWAFDHRGATKDQTAIASDAFAVAVHKTNKDAPVDEEVLVKGVGTPNADYEKDGNIYINGAKDIFIYVE